MRSRAGGLGLLGAPEHGAYAGEQLARVEGLRDVVVGAYLEPDDAGVVVAAGGEHDHRHVARRTQRAAHLEAVDPGQHHVEQDRVEAPLFGPREAELARGHVHDLGVVLSEVLGEELRQIEVVVDEEHSQHARVTIQAFALGPKIHGRCLPSGRRWPLSASGWARRAERARDSAEKIRKRRGGRALRARPRPCPCAKMRTIRAERRPRRRRAGGSGRGGRGSRRGGCGASRGRPRPTRRSGPAGRARRLGRTWSDTTDRARPAS
jgi:hypothetical protein